MPIITSSTRKDTKALSQLISYVYAEERNQGLSIAILHNISAKEHDLKAIQQAFKENDRFRKKRKGGVVLYHDIISFHPLDNKHILYNPNILEDIAREYIERRSPNGLAFGKLHIDTINFHIHVIYSATEKNCSTSIRISKKEFTALRRGIEQYQLQHYPDLEHSYVHQQHRKKLKQQISSKGKEYGM